MVISGRRILLSAFALFLVAVCTGFIACGGGSSTNGLLEPGPPPGSASPSPTPSPVFFYGVPTANSFTSGIASGPDGNIWFAETTLSVSKMGRVNISNGQLTEFSLPPCAIGPEYFAAGSDGDLWVNAVCPRPPLTEMVKLSTTGSASLLVLPTAPGALFHETLGPDGNIWFTFQPTNYVGKITPSGVATYYSLATAAVPRHGVSNITTGPDGNLWISENSEPYIDRITTNGTILNEYNVGTLTDGITAGPDGNIWFTSFDGDQIGHISMSGQVVVNQLDDYCAGNNPLALVGPLNIITGPDHNLWFTDVYADAVTRMTTSGQMTWFCMPLTDSGPFDLTVGSDGNIWFTFPGMNEIGKINMASLTQYKAEDTVVRVPLLNKDRSMRTNFHFVRSANLSQR
jgi:virginiamycin B lyase